MKRKGLGRLGLPILASGSQGHGENLPYLCCSLNCEDRGGKTEKSAIRKTTELNQWIFFFTYESLINIYF